MERRTTRAVVRVLGLAALVALTGLAPSATSASAPPIDRETLDSITPSPDVELTQDDAEALLDQLSGATSGGSGDSSLTGPCGGVAFSYDSNGVLIDAAYDAGDAGPPIDLLDGGPAFTSGNRYRVDTNGTVAYYGFAPLAGDGPMGYNYSLGVAGITVASGEEDNTAGENRNGGIIELSSELPFSFDAKISADGVLKVGDAEFCAGEGYVEFEGDGIVSVPGLVGLGLLGVGVLGVFINARPARTWKV